MDTKTLVLMDAVLELTIGISVDDYVAWKDRYALGNIELYNYLDDYWERISESDQDALDVYELSDMIVTMFRDDYEDFPTND